MKLSEWDFTFSPSHLTKSNTRGRGESWGLLAAGGRRRMATGRRRCTSSAFRCSGTTGHNKVIEKNNRGPGGFGQGKKEVKSMVVCQPVAGGRLIQQRRGETGEGRNRGEALAGWSGERGKEAEGIREGFGKLEALILVWGLI